jgi:hypothetical protein
MQCPDSWFRDNGGGRLNEIVDLYSYLADSFVFLDKSEVVSKSSLMEALILMEVLWRKI